MLLFPEWFKRRHCRMQSEKSVEIEHGLPGNIYRRPHGVIGGLAVGHNDVQPVRRSALEDYDQPIAANARVRRAKGRARQKPRQRGCGGKCGQRAVAQEHASSSGHKGSSRFPVLSTKTES
jgi:hypothetical protein